MNIAITKQYFNIMYSKTTFSKVSRITLSNQDTIVA